MKHKRTIFFLLILFIIPISHNILVKDFNDLVPADIKTISMRSQGNGIFYTTSDDELINKFESIMTSKDYLRTIMINYSSGNQGMVLEGENSEDASEIIFYGSNKISINQKPYIIIGLKEGELKEFFSEFFLDKNAVEE